MPLEWRRAFALGLLTLAVATLPAAACSADRGYNEDELILATTTSLHDSGLLDELAPIFEAEQSISVKIISVGTGAALRMGAEGNADVLLTHAPASERALLDNGDVTSRTLVAYNDFVIIGPPDDPARIGGSSDAADALAQIAQRGASGGAAFLSRGDDSGTHKKERALWTDAGLSPAFDTDEWYEEVGQGMSATLTVANQRGAYTLTDRGTYLALSSDIPNLIPLVAGDARLLNFYSVMEVNGDKGRINTAAAAAFRAFLLRDDVQALIGGYLRDVYGQPLFIPAGEETETSIAARSDAQP